MPNSPGLQLITVYCFGYITNDLFLCAYKELQYGIYARPRYTTYFLRILQPAYPGFTPLLLGYPVRIYTILKHTTRWLG
jgi:hypothetical protein